MLAIDLIHVPIGGFLKQNLMNKMYYTCYNITFII